jgi:hypothetical protein
VTPALVVLAAGLGQRFGGLKQLAAVGPRGEPILDYTVRDGRAAGFGTVVLVVRAEIQDAISEHVRRRWPAEIAADVRFAVQDRQGRSKPPGTAHAVVVAARATPPAAPFAVVNADDWYGVDAFGKLREGLDAGPAVLVAHGLANTIVGARPVSRALCDVDAAGNLSAVDEGTVTPLDGSYRWVGADGDRRLDGTELVSMNCWGFRPDLVEALSTEVDRAIHDHDEVLLPDVVQRLIASGLQVGVRPTTESCFGITYAEDVALLRATFATPAW